MQVAALPNSECHVAGCVNEVSPRAHFGDDFGSLLESTGSKLPLALLHIIVSSTDEHVAYNVYYNFS